MLLKRGEEMILVSPNSVIGVPAEKKEGLSTTIKQQAGSILLDVEKRNVKHFEVETPYLAAVVKGTQFRVTVNATSTSVDVIRGQVEVADFRTGQIAQVFGQRVEDRRAALRIGRGRHQSAWLVIEEQPRALRARQRFAVVKHLAGQLARLRTRTTPVRGSRTAVGDPGCPRARPTSPGGDSVERTG